MIVAIVVAVTAGLIAGKLYRKWRDEHAGRIASEKYQKKAGWMTKGFKIKRELADEFAEACETAGVSQASKISELMKGFIEEVNSEK